MTLIGDELDSLPIEHVFAAPLVAGLKAELIGAQMTYDYIEKVGFVKDKNGNTIVRTSNVDYENSVLTNDKETKQVSRITFPFLTLVPIPSLGIKDIVTKFKFKIDTMNKLNKDTKVEINAKARYNFLGWHANVEGKVSHDRFSFDKVDKNAELDIEMRTERLESPPGIMKMLEMLTNTIKISDSPNSEDNSGSDDDVTSNEDDDVDIDG